MTFPSELQLTLWPCFYLIVLNNVLWHILLLNLFLWLRERPRIMLLNLRARSVHVRTRLKSCILTLAFVVAIVLLCLVHFKQGTMPLRRLPWHWARVYNSRLLNWTTGRISSAVTRAVGRLSYVVKATMMHVEQSWGVTAVEVISKCWMGITCLHGSRSTQTADNKSCASTHLLSQIVGL